MKYSFIILLVLLVTGCEAQMLNDTSRRSSPFKQYVPQEELDKFNLRQMEISRRGMLALTVWGGGNVIYGSVAGALTHGEQQAFHITNAIWGATNALIAIPGLVSSLKKQRGMNLSYGKTILRQQNQEKLFLINGALDFAYIGAGAAMWGFSDRINNTNTRNGIAGAGEAFILQGGFLLFFDWTMYLVQASHGAKLNRYTSGLACTGNGMSYHLEF